MISYNRGLIGGSMRYLLTEEQKMIVDICLQIVAERIVPVRAELDESGTFPREIIDEIGKVIFSEYLYLKNMKAWVPAFSRYVLLQRNLAGVI